MLLELLLRHLAYSIFGCKLFIWISIFVIIIKVCFLILSFFYSCHRKSELEERILTLFLCLNFLFGHQIQSNAFVVRCACVGIVNFFLYQINCIFPFVCKLRFAKWALVNVSESTS